MNALLKKGRPREKLERRSEASPLYPKSRPEQGQWRRGRCLFAQPEMLRGPWCLSISPFLLSRRESKAAEVMSHRSCVVLSLLKSSFQLVILMRPHNNPGNC